MLLATTDRTPGYEARAYEHLSVSLEKATGEVITNPKQQFLHVPDVKPVVKHEDSTSVMQNTPWTTWVFW